MGFIKLICLALAGAAVMIASLMWVAQFFTGKHEGTPVIWLESLPSENQNDSKQKNGDEPYVEFQQ